MFNVRFFKGDTITAQSIKLIKKGKIVFALQQTIVIIILKGEEIYENYGPLFFHSRRADRRDRLKKQYW